MKLNKFRIQNYKSIVDTGICYLNQDLTIMAGMNESGKSSILEAIRDFDVNKAIVNDAIRVKEDTGKPLVTLYFTLNEDDVENFCAELDLEENEDTAELKNYLKNNDIGITKDIEGEYSLDEEFTEFISIIFQKNYKNFYTSCSSQIKKLKNFEELKSIDFSKVNAKSNLIQVSFLVTAINKIIKPTKKVNSVDSTGKTIVKEVSVESGIDENTVTSINEIITSINDTRIKTFNQFYSHKFVESLIDIVKSYLPRIMFFSSFDDILNYDVLIQDLQEKEINVELCNIAGIDIEKLKKMIENEDYQRVTNYLGDKSAKISASFKSEWLQDEITIAFTTNKELMHFGIKEEGDTATYRAEQRSKGFQWFLSFYIKLNAENNKNTNIILVDEPGLYLHAKAQEDVLHLLEKLSKDDKDTSVIITTHSPYLIDIDNLNRILLVEKDDIKGTQVVKPHKGATKNTLTPIITKMGFDIAKSNFIREKNVLLEGISDYYYLQAFKKILSFEDYLKNVSFIPAVGASQVPQLASFCIGWGLKYVALFDHDGEGENNAKTILDNLKEQASIAFICDEDKCAIEDLFTTADFNSLLLSKIDSKNDDTSITNTKYLKENKIDKVLLAKMFCDNANNLKIKNFDKSTVDKFKKLFNNIFKTLDIKIKTNKQD